MNGIPALIVSFFLVGSVSALAQSHPQHPGRPHGPDHVRPTSLTHEQVHGLLGNWHGTSSSAGHDAQKLHLAVSADKEGKVTFKMNASPVIGIGAARDLAMEGNTIQWTQDVSGTPCKARAVLTPATATLTETMKGAMTCQQGEIAFELQKTKA